ncbi:Fc receptor-like protein 5 [Lampris incognitus]|uniref:Fc receptor-like protein 5 n=1 Tax=Lampris incognitus TaxID=2546036 RepID=UPI0024B4FACA|nr:Fc receptor-like protein 5 [Lampris incognitus]
MDGWSRVILSAVLVIVARSQQLPQVSMVTPFTPLFSGDTVTLRCDVTPPGSQIAWYFKDDPITDQGKQFYVIAAAGTQHSGPYRCEANGQRSNEFLISVYDLIPLATLSISTGWPVTQTGGSFILALEAEDGLQGWRCWVYKEEMVKRIAFRQSPEPVKLLHLDLANSMGLYWCSSDNNLTRSNPITIRTSEKLVLLESLPGPARVGGSLTLECVVVGTKRVSRVAFYKDGQVIQTGTKTTYEISNVTLASEGSYKCEATYNFSEQTEGPPYQEASDAQPLFVQASPLKTVVEDGMSCSCSRCTQNASYQWYYKKTPDKPWAPSEKGVSYSGAKEEGMYACRAVWPNMRSLMSDPHTLGGSNMVIVVTVVLIGIVMALIVLTVAVLYYKTTKRRHVEPLYQDVGMTVYVSPSDEGDGDTYEPLRDKPGTTRDDYQTIVSRGEERVAGDYQKMEQVEEKDGMYHTLQKVEQSPSQEVIQTGEE